MTKTALRPRALPQRTCVGCGTIRSKREMVRVVRSPDGRVSPDPSGKAAGRGAYLCPSEKCWELGLAKGRLERSLKAQITSGDAEAMRAHARALGLSDTELGGEVQT